MTAGWTARPDPGHPSTPRPGDGVPRRCWCRAGRRSRSPPDPPPRGARAPSGPAAAAHRTRPTPGCGALRRPGARPGCGGSATVRGTADWGRLGAGAGRAPADRRRRRTRRPARGRCRRRRHDVVRAAHGRRGRRLARTARPARRPPGTAQDRVPWSRDPPCPSAFRRGPKSLSMLRRSSSAQSRRGAVPPDMGVARPRRRGPGDRQVAPPGAGWLRWSDSGGVTQYVETLSRRSLTGSGSSESFQSSVPVPISWLLT